MRKNIPIIDIYMEEGWSRSCLESVRIIDGGMLRMSIADTIIMIVDEQWSDGALGRELIGEMVVTFSRSTLSMLYVINANFAFVSG